VNVTFIAEEVCGLGTTGRRMRSHAGRKCAVSWLLRIHPQFTVSVKTVVLKSILHYPLKETFYNIDTRFPMLTFSVISQITSWSLTACK